MISSDRLAALLRMLQEKRCPEFVSRSGLEAENNDCFSTRFVLDEVEYLFRSIDGESVTCLTWDSQLREFRSQAELSIFDVLRAKPSIRHFYGRYDIDWDSWNSFSFEQWHKWTYAKIYYYKVKHHLESKWISQRKLVTVVRFRALKAVWTLHDQEEMHVTSLSVLMEIHGPNFFLHPDYRRADRSLSTVLDSLVETGELTKSGSDHYLVTGMGVAALERIEEEDRRHRDNRRSQMLMLLLTIVLALAALFQANVLKAPPLVEFKNWFWETDRDYRDPKGP